MKAFKHFAHHHRVLSVIILIIIGLVSTVGIFQLSEQTYMYSIVMGPQGTSLIEDMLKNDDPNAFTPQGKIKSYRVLTKTIEHNPMGGIMARIELNNDSNLIMGIAFEKNNQASELYVRETFTYPQVEKLYKQLKTD
ncbi:DUF1310 family protein [Alloscardovia theropitheci]|uniref:DUF1310 family protein n=1 Tax=Alloscardovia theropitheci TaxID=2496842 RepID=A0A4R0QTT6_9BIFI|nr:DUF1310 family protein [Alloscardovia theropitheci]TCD54735.1 DUF1310 family protein [Alloscardovia theropitheci]